MRFRLNERFSADQLSVSITYLDRGRGSWSLGVSGQQKKKTVRNTDSGEWKTLSVAMPRAALRDAELIINFEGGEDTAFHMVEVQKIPSPKDGRI